MSRRKRPTEEEIEQFEVIARREAAWGRYGAIMRQQNFDREKKELEREVARAAPREKTVVERRLEDFLQSARRNAGTVYIGSGLGSNDPEDTD